MSSNQAEIGFATAGNAMIYYEDAGKGQPLLMIHAGVADHRQWNNEFTSFAQDFRVIRYDLRGYGKSEPVEGEFTHMNDLAVLLDHLRIREPIVMMGCSMGGSLAMDFALLHPFRVKALVMVDSGPSGLKLNLPPHPLAKAVEKAYDDGELDLVAELETQIWFDGIGRTPQQVNQAMRKLAFDMNRLALSYEAKQLGNRLPDADIPAAKRLAELEIPVLIVVGGHDIPYILAAADYMVEKLPSAYKVVIEDAAHLPNMDHPDEFQQILKTFLDTLPA